jgi:GNAT superfamily N-acetyltransferase
MTTVDIREIPIHSDDAQRLIGMLDQELLIEYPPEHVHAVDVESFHRNGGVFVVGYDAEMPIACGALRPVDRSEVELKRMYVVDSRRGRGVSRQILQFLETKARQLGFARLVLETGDAQHSAIRLYSTAGFDRIESFGEYGNGIRSICFAKDL